MEKQGVFRMLVLITQFGINMLVPILLCTFLGAYLGKKFSMPILAVPLFIIGALAGFRNVWVLAQKTYNRKDGDNAKKAE